MSQQTAKTSSTQSTSLTFDEYDDYQRSIIPYFKNEKTTPEDLLLQCAFGVGEEAGEVLGKFKRRYREGGVDDQDILIEMGDLLGYMSALADAMGYSLQQIAEMNIDKLNKRIHSKTILGSGDKR
jgi:NTP pyrophosphatase (non-canonical NTP hydrolase)